VRNATPVKGGHLEKATSAPGKAVVPDFGGDQPRDQETGNYEEDIDADKAACESGNMKVEKHDRQDRDRPQPVDIGAVGGGMADTLPVPTSFLESERESWAELWQEVHRYRSGGCNKTITHLTPPGRTHGYHLSVPPWRR
jgi:hypothetical protein